MTAPLDVSRPKSLVGSVILLLLAEAPGHGYELSRRLAAEGFCYSTPIGRVYRELSVLEEANFIRSALDVSYKEGPRRRIYEITPQGIDALVRRMEWVSSLGSYTLDVLRRCLLVKDGPAQEPSAT